MRDAPCNNCHICGSAGTLLHEGVTDRLFGVPGRWNLRKCGNAACGLVWLDPKPLESELHKAYADYFTHGDYGRSDSRKLRDVARQAIRALEQLWLALLFQRSARSQIDTLFLNGLPKGRLLEVGCGEGRLLAKMRRRGWDVEGQDVDPAAAEQARRISGAKLHVGDLTQLGLAAGSYDAIVMNHVIEHAHDPTALVRECRRLLKPGGLFVATTPNPSSFGHAKFGAAWLGLDPPRHIHLLPPTALAGLADAGGFRECQVFTSAARAGGILAASAEILRTGQYRMRGRVTLLQIVSAAWYQLAARIAHILNDMSGEETVLRAKR